MSKLSKILEKKQKRSNKAWHSNGLSYLAVWTNSNPRQRSNPFDNVLSEHRTALTMLLIRHTISIPLNIEEIATSTTTKCFTYSNNRLIDNQCAFTGHLLRFYATNKADEGEDTTNKNKKNQFINSFEFRS